MKRIISTIFTLLREPAQPSSDRCSDSELIARFVRTSDSAALELLFLRHGPLVWSICCRILGASAEAEDAFQATFIVLARKARTITNGSVFASWLHRVAWRTAVTVQTTRSRRLRQELPIEDIVDLARNDDPSLKLQSAEQNEILDRELSRLPSKYRMPLILCDLENWTRDAAAAELRCPIGTLNSRLSRGREMLRGRLQRCGITFAGLVAVHAVPAGVFAAWQHRCASPPESVQHLADSTIRSMAVAGARKAAAVVALCGMLAVGTTLMAMGITNQGNPSPATNETAQNSSADPDKKNEDASRFIDPDAGPLPEGAIAQIGSKRLRHSGEVTGLRYSPDGKWLASISTSHADATARLWDVATGKQQLLVKIEAERENVLHNYYPEEVCRALGFSPDSKQFFVIDSESFRAFEIASGKELFKHSFPKKEPPGRQRPFRDENVIGGAISPDGKTFVILQREGPIEIRDLASGKVLRSIEHSFKNYFNVPIEFSPDSRFSVYGKVRQKFYYP
jgi:RNA polymerase sigma factor (sigma-70 family)